MNKFLLTAFSAFCFITGYAQDGVLDTEFGVNGTVIDQSSSSLTTLTIVPNGKIISGGSSLDIDNTSFLRRFNPDGTLDTTFGVNGSIYTGVADSQYHYTLLSETSMFTLDRINEFNGSVNVTTGSLKKYDLDGNPDLTFGINGTVSFTDIIGRYLIIQPDGKFLICGQKQMSASLINPILMRFNPDGTHDAAFGSAGIVTFPQFQGTFHKLMIDNENNIYAVGRDGLAKFDSNGQLFAGFGNSGAIKTTNYFNPFFEIYSLAFTSDNKIVVAGLITNLEQTESNMALYRFNANGTIDTSFGVNGVAKANFGMTFGKTFDMVQQNDGKYVLAGFVANQGQTLYSGGLARFNVNGTTDTTFGNNGVILYNMENSDYDLFYRLSLYPNGAIIVVGRNNDNGFIQKYLSGDSLGTVDFSKGDDTYIYPNPLTEASVLEYTLSKTETINVELIDVNGRVLKTYIANQEQPAGLYRQQLNTADLPSGTYFITLTSAKGKITVKAIK